MSENVLVFDIETIGKTFGEYGLTADTVDYLRAKLGRKRTLKDDCRTDGVKECDFSSLDIDLAQVICVGEYLLKEGVGYSSCYMTGTPVKSEEEKRILSAFIGDLKENSPIHIVSFNGRQFDLPILARKAARYGLSSPFLALGKNRRHLDLADYLGGYGGQNLKTLDFYCDLFQIEKVGSEYSGADIRSLYEAGEWDKIKAKCVGDVKATYELYRKLEGFIGEG